MYEIDHVLIFSSTGAPEAERLIAFGLTEGSPNRHSGQGTANRRFFFDNAMLELLWVENPEEAQSEGICRLGLWERWSRRGAGACPFGICYRPASEPGIAPPFKSRMRRSPLLSPSHRIISMSRCCSIWGTSADKLVTSHARIPRAFAICLQP